MTTALMNTPARRGRWLRVLLGGVLLAGLALLAGPASPASAHAALLRTNPPADAVVPTSPGQVTLTFSEAVAEVPGKTRLIGPDGRPVVDGAPVFDGATITLPLPADAAVGTYLVSYRVISADGHPVAGAFTFSIGAPSAPPTEPAVEDDPLFKVLIPAVKFIGYAGLVLIVGPLLVLLLLWPRRLATDGPRRLLWTGVGLVAASTVVGLLLQAPYTLGTGLTDVSLADLRSVLRSTFGTAHVIRLVALAALVVLVRAVLAGRDERGGTTDRVLILVLGLIGLGTWPAAGHSGASPVPSVSVVIDTVHLTAMAVWVGGLVMLIGFLLRAANGTELEVILPTWSRWAAVAVAALALAGIVQALIEIGTVTALVGTTYGRLVLAKVALFGLVLCAAAVARATVRRRVGATPTQRLRRTIAVELTLAAVLLGVSAVLVQTTPARTAEATASAAGSTVHSVTLTSPVYTLQVEVDPAEVGNNTIHLYAYTDTNEPLPVVEWKATAALPAQGIEAIEIPLLRIIDNHSIGEITLPAAGDWVFTFTLRTSEIDQATVTTTVSVS